jgi:hypothetical protein
MVRKTQDGIELTLRGFSPAELKLCADKQCTNFGLKICESEIRPCMVSPGGHVRLYEGRFVAEPAGDAEDAA